MKAIASSFWNTTSPLSTLQIGRKIMPLFSGVMSEASNSCKPTTGSLRVLESIELTSLENRFCHLFSHSFCNLISLHRFWKAWGNDKCT